MNRSRFLRGNFEELGLSSSLAHAPPQSWLLQSVLRTAQLLQVPGDPFLSRGGILSKALGEMHGEGLPWVPASVP